MSDTTKLATPFEAQFHAGRAQEWAIQRLIGRINTATLVRVLAVHPEPGAVGFVDVEPMVQQVTTTGVVMPGAPLYRLPYLRAQGGVSAIILDPAPGDIGLAVFAQHDITGAATTREPGPPATARRYDAGDGLFVGGFLNADPEQYVEFLPEAAGINVHTPGDLTVTAGGDATITVGGDLAVTVAGSVAVSATTTTWSGPVTFTDPIAAPEAVVNGVGLAAHRHVSAGAGSPTGAPIP